MAIHTELPIYKVAYDLLGVVVQLVRNMPREFKQSIGGKIRDECIEIATLVFRANVAADKAPHLLELLERLQVAELPREALKDALRGWICRVELDPETRKGRVVYRLSLARDKVASPRRSGVIPDLLAAGPTFVVARHRRAATSRARC